jgi:pantoate--beta-alanine ligase
MTVVVRTRAELAETLARGGGRTGVVMTMGALHAGHAALMAAARKRVERLVVTIFVNPLQFGPNEDLDRYPRTLEADLELCRAAGVDVVFAPTAQEMYPNGEPVVRVDPGLPGEDLEGGSRPGFFTGVLTVVLKLLHLVRPDEAFFGEKDYQQLTMVRRMVRDLDLDVEIVGVPTVREPDGLALSSRNRYLSPAARTAALRLSAALRAGATAAEAGADGAGVLAAAHRAFHADDGTGVEVELDYLVLADPDLEPGPGPGPGRLLIAAWVDGTRLIDNMAVELGPGAAS